MYSRLGLLTAIGVLLCGCAVDGSRTDVPSDELRRLLDVARWPSIADVARLERSLNLRLNESRLIEYSPTRPEAWGYTMVLTPTGPDVAFRSVDIRLASARGQGGGLMIYLSAWPEASFPNGGCFTLPQVEAVLGRRWRVGIPVVPAAASGPMGPQNPLVPEPLRTPESVTFDVPGRPDTDVTVQFFFRRCAVRIIIRRHLTL